MSTIRYNTSSNLIQRIQRNGHLNKHTKRVTGSNENLDSTIIDSSSINDYNGMNICSKKGNNGIYIQNYSTNPSNDQLQVELIKQDDPSFISKYEKNTNEYLLDLCNSVFPSTLCDKIRMSAELNNGSLECLAFLSLIVKNFVSYWYGTKIPSEDRELLEEIFQICNKFILYVQDSTGNINMTSLLLDDIPLLIADHIKVLRTLKTHGIEQCTLEDYIKLSLIEQDTYPFVITELIKHHLPCKSTLQNTFLDSLLNQFLFGRILDSSIEPYYFLKAINKVSDQIIQKKESNSFFKSVNNNLIQRIGYKLVSFFSNVIKFKFNSITTHPDEYKTTENDVLGAYIWTLMSIDILLLHKKKPLLYTIFCYIRNILMSSNVLNVLINSLFLKRLQPKLLSSNNTKHIFNSLRTLLFPNDDLMGPRTVIPTGEDFINFKLQSVNKLWKVIQQKRLDTLLGITEDDIISSIDMICQQDKRCNKILFLRVFDCVAAHLTQDNLTEVS